MKKIMFCIGFVPVLAYAQLDEQVLFEYMQLKSLRSEVQMKIEDIEKKYPSLKPKSDQAYMLNMLSNISNTEIKTLENIITEDNFDLFNQLFNEILNSSQAESINQVIINKLISIKEELAVKVNQIPKKGKQ